MEAHVSLAKAHGRKEHGVPFVLRERRWLSANERVLRRGVTFHVEPAKLLAEDLLERGEGVVEGGSHARNYKQNSAAYLSEYAAAVTN
jgi:hypothetical protein